MWSMGKHNVERRIFMTCSVQCRRFGLAVFALVALVAALTSGEEVARPQETMGTQTMPTNDKALTAIVVADSPDEADRYAAAELAFHLEAILGQKLPMVTEGVPRPAGRAFVVGNTRTNLKKYKPGEWPPDTIYIGYGESDIAILGQGPQGTLFAVYEFLRDQGCRWYVPEHVGKAVVPKRDFLKLPDKPKKHTPTFIERGWNLPPASPAVWEQHYYNWAVRNGLNSIKAGTVIDYGPKYGRGLQIRGGHTLIVLVPSGDHPDTKATFAAHPEWYPLVNGQRVTQYKDGRPAMACVSNPDVVKEAARKVIDYLREHPDTWRFSVSPNDEPGYWCECKACLAMDGAQSRWKTNDLWDAYGVRSKSGAGPMSARWVKFINAVAKIVGEVYPDKSLSFYAYGSTVAPPTEPNWKLERNVIIDFAHGDGVCESHGADSADCPPNVAMNQWLTGWAKSGNPIIFYDYPPNGYLWDIPSGSWRRYSSLIRYTKRMGVVGWSGEGQGSWAGSTLWHYLKARLLWDAQTDVDGLVSEFYHDLYGPAAGTMKTFYKLFEDESQRVADHPVWGAWATKMTPASLRKLTDLLTVAEQEAESPEQRRNVAAMRVAMNGLILAWLNDTGNLARVEARAFDYDAIRKQTLLLIEQHSLRVAVTDAWWDQLSKGTYRAPAAALLGKEMATVSKGWKFRTDPNDEGAKAGWQQSPALESGAWHDIRVDQYWTEQGFDYHGVAWYATQIVVPAGGDDPLWLLFGMIDGDAEAWIDGKSVGSLPGDPWDKPKALEITRFLKRGQPALLVVRVVKTLYAAGINGSVKIVSSGGETAR